MKKLTKISNVLNNINKVIYSSFDSKLLIILNNWYHIINDEVCFNNTLPIKITRKNNKTFLHVRSNDHLSLMKIKYSEEGILQNIAIFFGYRLIDKIITCKII